MPRGDAPGTSSRRNVDRLRALARDPAAQSAFALEIIRTERQPWVLEAALDAIAAFPVAGAKEAVLDLYEWHRQDPKKRDPGGMVRAAALRALKPTFTTSDIPFLEEAILTVEPKLSLQDPLGPSGVQGAALIGLAMVDDRLATFHAVAALARYQAEAASAELGATAVRTLAALEQQALLYYLVADPVSEWHPSFLSEALKGLAGAPEPFVLEAVRMARASESDDVHLGLADLFVAHPGGGLVSPLAAYLASGIAPEILRYLAASIVASRRPELLDLLVKSAADEVKEGRRGILRDALAYAPADVRARVPWLAEGAP
jgi:hypothetical protein